MPTAKRLQEPILDGGIRSTNYFNGRVLTAEDLRADQEANRQQRQRLGRVVGEGVYCGLEVTRVGSTTVTVTPGEAMNREGRGLALSSLEPVTLELVPESQTADGAAAVRGKFQACTQQVISAVNTGYGLYLLVAAPAGGYEGSAPSTGIPGDGRITGCGSRYAVDGIQFRLALYRTAESLVEYEPMRNLAAHDFFGTTDPALADLFAARTEYGEMDQVRTRKIIGPAEVPLALLHWGPEGIDWLDMWAVRRRVAPVLSGSPWDALVGPRRQAEAEAIFLQFQDDLAAYRESSDVAVPALRSHFRYLPPFGYVPISEGDSGESQVAAYFEGIHWMQVYPDEAFLRSMLLKAALVDPVDLKQETDYPTVGVFWQAGMPYAVFFRKGRGNRATARV
jgi:hypothetical protein